MSWRDLFQTVGPVALISTAAVLLALHFVRPAPPSSLTLSAGPPGSSFQSAAQQYQKILARNGIQLKIVNSEGSLDNLNRLTDENSGVDVAFVQSGITGDGDASDLVSLGSMFYQPVIIFYRSHEPIERLSELHGRRIAIGGKGSGTRVLALALLKDNEIEAGGATTLSDLEGEAARTALLNDQVDAIMISGDSASPGTIRAMLHAPGIRLYDFPQADAYVRRFPFLSKLAIPAGAFDLGENLPPKPINMVAPTVELISHTDLHPALSDLLIEAALEVHGRATLLQNAGAIPRRRRFSQVFRSAPRRRATTSPAAVSRTATCRSGWQVCLRGRLRFWCRCSWWSFRVCATCRSSITGAFADVFIAAMANSWRSNARRSPVTMSEEWRAALLPSASMRSNARPSK